MDKEKQLILSYYQLLNSPNVRLVDVSTEDCAKITGLNQATVEYLKESSEPVPEIEAEETNDDE